MIIHYSTSKLSQLSWIHNSSFFFSVSSIFSFIFIIIGSVKLRLFHLQYWIQYCFWFLHYTDKQIVSSNCIHVCRSQFSYCFCWYMDSYHHQDILFYPWNTGSLFQSDFSQNGDIIYVLDLKSYTPMDTTYYICVNYMFCISLNKRSIEILCYNMFLSSNM